MPTRRARVAGGVSFAGWAAAGRLSVAACRVAVWRVVVCGLVIGGSLSADLTTPGVAGGASVPAGVGHGGGSRVTGIRPGERGVPGRRVVIVFVGSRDSPMGMLSRLGADRSIDAVGLMDPSDGNYNEQQALLDVTQSTHVSNAAYTPHAPPAISVSATGRVSHWGAVLRRARGAIGSIQPGLFASSIPGGVAYAGGSGRPGLEAVVGADRRGQVARISIGSAGTLSGRTRALLRDHLVVVVGEPSFGGLAAVLAGRRRGDLTLVVEEPPRTAASQEASPRLLAIAASGLPGSGSQLTTTTTRQPGLVTGLDIAPTAVAWLGLRAPAGFAGHPITKSGARDVSGLRGLDARLRVISGRRWPTIEAFVGGWVVLVLGGAAVCGRRGIRASLRLGGLTALWTPCTMLIAGAVAPTLGVEVGVIVGGGLVLAVVTDRLAPWPRGPGLPAAAMVVAYTIDLVLGSPLIARSLLGSNPIAGARFYGVGNEMEAALPIVLFAGLAAALPQRAAGRRETMIFAVVGLLFTGVIASGRLGADVGAVFTIGGGTAAGALVLGRTRSRRALGLAVATPFVGLVALAGFDLVTSAGGHYTHTILQASSIGDVLDTMGRKLDSARRQLIRGVMPINTVVCLAAGMYVFRHRDRVLAPTGAAAGWRACLVAGFAGSILGSLANDSGPVLLVIGSFGLACVLGYVRGDPRLGAP